MTESEGGRVEYDSWLVDLAGKHNGLWLPWLVIFGVGTRTDFRGCVVSARDENWF